MMQYLKMTAFGFFGAFLFLIAQKTFLPSASAASANVVTASGFNLVDAQGRLWAQLGFSKEGPPGFWIFDEKGIARIAMGLYPDQTSHLGLQDKNGLMVELMRSFGPDERPLLIFKTKGSDSMIAGLNPGDAAPFLMHYEEGRKRKLEFGRYDGP